MSPFNWKSAPSQVSWSDQNKHNKVSTSMSAAICAKRKAGIEPSLVCDYSSHKAADPKMFAIKREKND